MEARVLQICRMVGLDSQSRQHSLTKCQSPSGIGSAGRSGLFPSTTRNTAVYSLANSYHGGRRVNICRTGVSKDVTLDAGYADLVDRAAQRVRIRLPRAFENCAPEPFRIVQLRGHPSGGAPACPRYRECPSCTICDLGKPEIPDARAVLVGDQDVGLRGQ